MNQYPDHKKKLDALKRIEGQVRGIQNMVEEGRYCVEILTQISAAINALARVQDDILSKHLSCCVVKAFKEESKTQQDQKIEEITKLLKTFRKN